ncbi:MAG: nucleotidyltransferase family protein [Solirubrobacterales bacterium]
MAARGSVAGIVLAAGRGSRFGAPKQLATFRGRPLLEQALLVASDAGLAPFVVVLGSDADRILAAVELQGARPVICERWEEGQAASLQAGIDAVGDAEAAIITLGDQPLLSAGAIERVAAARRPGVVAVRATYEGVPGHPVLLERVALERAKQLDGDQGARELLAGSTVRAVPCEDLGSGADVDTPEQLAELERSPEV